MLIFTSLTTLTIKIAHVTCLLQFYFFHSQSLFVLWTRFHGQSPVCQTLWSARVKISRFTVRFRREVTIDWYLLSYFQIQTRNMLFHCKTSSIQNYHFHYLYLPLKAHLSGFLTSPISRLMRTLCLSAWKQDWDYFSLANVEHINVGSV